MHFFGNPCATLKNNLNMKKYFFIWISLLFLSDSKAQDPPDFYVEGVSDPVINLNGTWKFCLNPSGEFWLLDHLSADWKDIRVPGECMMQGFSIQHDRPFVYKKEFSIPPDFEGKIIKLRFEGVYSYARVWVNGKYLRDHSGGFTAWECDITQAVTPGQTAHLTVEVTDRADEISYASGYAKHPIGGILRNVSLLALPVDYPDQLFVITDLDEHYRNAVLTVQGKLRNEGKNYRIELDLVDPADREMELSTPSIEVSDTIFKIANYIENPLKWDAEHPNLYRLKVSLTEDGKLIWNKNLFIGFREIEIIGNRFLVNGKQVKLRGACRHDIHPLMGRVSTPEYELKDILLAKEANINFIRTSHYPPTDHFLQLCDEYGIYVEDETAVCFVGSHRTEEYFPGNSESDPAFTGRYLSQLKEMVYDHRNHPSILIWSIGNENRFGTNFKRSYDWVKRADPTRPVIFSYPGHVPDSVKAYDLLSMHYPGTDGYMDQYGIITEAFGHTDMPVLFDEWAHVACYNNMTVKEDPNIRDFWGMSLDSMWQITYDSDGGLGGAIWGMIDETFMLPPDLPGYNEWWGKIDPKVIPGEYTGHTIGYGEWGIIDTWRRKKPEFWNVKKAYSPVKILKTEFRDHLSGDYIEIPVYNRFDFTNLNELSIHYTFRGIRKELHAPDIPAHSRGTIRIPMMEWPPGEPVSIDIFDSQHRLVDKYLILHHKEESSQEITRPDGEIILTRDKEQYIISCENSVKLYIDRNTGLFSHFSVSDEKYMFSGPYLNLRTRGEEKIYSSHRINDYGSGWKLKTLSVDKKENLLAISAKGVYATPIEVEFLIRVFADGSINTTYTVSEMPDEFIRELGIKYLMEDIFDTLSWNRNTYWSFYPSDHLSAGKANVSLFTANPKTYREVPEKDWPYDTKSFYYEGTQDERAGQLCRIAKATKENVREYDLRMKGGGHVVVVGKGREGCRIDRKENRIRLYLNNELDYPDLSWGNFQRNLTMGKKYRGNILIKIVAGNSHNMN